LPNDQLYDDLTIENLDEIHDKMIENKKNGENTFLLIDDFQQKLKEPAIAKKLEQVIIRYRHLNSTVIFLQQNYNKCHQAIRIICSNLIFSMWPG
jgi:type IV secretory pathway VirB4 component